MCDKCKKPFYITTPIYYPSDKLHIGLGAGFALRVADAADYHGGKSHQNHYDGYYHENFDKRKRALIILGEG